ncbi:DUF3108 domain-containing protein [Aquincola sp. S2]|uniref:DUF3108 domain-containing protein n=1 Tax=Pseudaquabacterium terrae TaxID=2732868 RepID=A0ABX2EDU3_9BURK|nr:DUF3108 domain-containing protein [Aquabacterium terrae]NRF66784.1 DUF3108 domain-containing protein [Aquabacterium terrae]
MADIPRVGTPGHPLLGRRAGWGLLAVVTLLHLLAADELVSDRFGDGDASRAMARIEVAFVRELAQAAPPEVAPPVRAKPAERALPPVAERPQAPASAPAAVVPEPLPASAVPEPAPASAVAAASEPAPEAAPPPTEPPRSVASADPPPSVAASEPAVAAAVAAAPSAASTAAANTAAFDWPPSTRLSYTVDGYFRGPLPGEAQVEWLRSGSRYQVHLKVSVGGGAMKRRASSEGELTERGLQPRRFEGEQGGLFGRGRRWSQQFGAERIALHDGSEIDTLPGVQDEASQFVQLTWLFTTQPQLLQVGRSIEIPLMINRRLDRWIYDIKEQQTLHLPFGDVPAYYIKPRRDARPGTMVAEVWIAPTLQYLPARILIRQDESTYADMTLDRAPLQAGGEPVRR